MSDSQPHPAADSLEWRHAEAEALATSFSYAKPSDFRSARAAVALARTDLFRARVTVLKKGQGENSLHYHTNADSFWMVLKGRVRFYGPGDKPIGEFGPNEGTTTPRYARYWFENAGDEDLEILHLFILATPGFEQQTGHTPLAASKTYTSFSADNFDARKL